MPTLCSVLHIQPHVVQLSRTVRMELVHMCLVHRLVHRQQDTQMSRYVCCDLLHTCPCEQTCNTDKQLHMVHRKSASTGQAVKDKGNAREDLEHRAV